MIYPYLLPLTFGLNVVPRSLEEKNSNRSFNPDCPTEDAARDCENICFTANVNCIADCGTNTECIRQCSRDYTTCIEVCPCYSGCYNGCPCSYETVYCDSCELKFEKEHRVCRDFATQNLNLCLQNCPFNQTSCDLECFGVFNNHDKVRFDRISQSPKRNPIKG